MQASHQGWEGMEGGRLPIVVWEFSAAWPLRRRILASPLLPFTPLREVLCHFIEAEWRFSHDDMSFAVNYFAQQNILIRR